MKGQRRSEKNRADKYSRRAAAMLDQYHWDEAQAHFLAMMESTIMNIAEIRELTWAQFRDSFEGLHIQDQLLTLREEYLESFRNHIREGKGFYDEDLNSSDGSPRVFSRDDLKNITKELDQFKV